MPVRVLVLVTLLTSFFTHAATPEVRAASVDFSTRGLKPQLGSVFSERFALFLRDQGIAVTTSKDISAMLSVERQRQLLGCAEGSETCLTELAGALGVTALITGQVGRIGRTFQLSVRVLDARNAATLFVLSKTLKTEEEVLEALEAAAPEAAEKLKAAFLVVPAVEPQPPAPPPPLNVVTAPPVERKVVDAVAPGRSVGPWVLTASASGALGGGAALLLTSVFMTTGAVNAELTPSAYSALVAQAERLRLVGAITAGVGAAALVGGLLWLALPRGSLSVTLVLEPARVTAGAQFVW